MLKPRLSFICSRVVYLRAFSLLLVAALASVSVGCGDSANQGGGAADTAVAEDTSQEDTGAADTGAVDTANVDSGGADVGPVCPGGAGCPCDANSDCDAGICLEGAQGKRCAQPCVDSCPSGFRCAQVPQGSDVVTVCVDASARLCSPCAESKDCIHPGVVDARCIDRGAAGAFCGAACKGDGDCPKGYACKDAKDVDGDTTSQCLPVDDGGALAACTCSKNAVSLGLKGVCSKAVVQGEVELVCAGELRCEAAGAAAVCKANEPGKETCDGADNDCDGETDEGGCDDGNACTTDSCGPGADGVVTCAHKAQPDGVACDADGSVCTEGDACKGGSCEVGGVKSCDDGNPCTKDACDVAAGCTQTADDGAPCDDDNPCTQGDVCAGGGCQAGVPKTCDSGNPCVLAKCDLKTGKCAFEDATDGAVCDDGDACSDKDACAKGTCKGQPKSCDDGNPCTSDSCDKAKGCVAAPKPGPCDDGDPCTEGDACAKGVCGPGKAICECKKDSDCKDDGDLCNGTPICDTSKAPYVCKTDPKTVVTCDPAGGSTCSPNTCAPATGKCAPKAAADGISCSDDDACTAGDACKAGACAAGPAVDCKDGNVCTADSCDKAKGCVFAPQAGLTQPCYEGPKGTAGVGQCVAGKQACDAKGQLGPCLGAVTPVKTELCDGKDDDCDGKTDEICAPTAIAVSQAPVMDAASGGGKQLRAAVQTGPSGVSGGGKATLDWSLEALWRLWWSSK